jgi:hypothetical protein
MLLEKIQLEPGEEILKLVRKHWLVIGLELFGMVLVAIVPIFLLVGVMAIPQTNIISFKIEHVGSLITFGIATWLLLSSMAGFMIWTHYYLDLWIITDRRIILIDQIGFFNRSVAIFRLERLQDIEFKISGLIGTFFNFGTLSAQTAGHNEANFRSTGLPDPGGLQNLIQSAMDRRLAEVSGRPFTRAEQTAGE